jgi:hypothetical protein
MSNYKTTDYIIETVYSLLGAISVPKYLNTRPTESTASEYVVINALPINANVMQKCYVNVNYHVKDIDGGPGVGNVADEIKLANGTASVLDILEKVTTATYLIDFESQETIRENQIAEHYSNLRFSFKNINN